MAILRCNRCGREAQESTPLPRDSYDMNQRDEGVCGGVFKIVDGNADYVTQLACTNPRKAIVAVMHYNKAEDSYGGKKFSEPLSLKGAEALAASWAKALGLEVR